MPTKKRKRSMFRRGSHHRRSDGAKGGPFGHHK